MNEKKHLSDEEIDEIVIAQVDDDVAWEEAIEVEPDISLTINLPPDLAARAALFARLHDVSDVETWVQQIIRERIDFEESALADLKRVMEKKRSYQA